MLIKEKECEHCGEAFTVNPRCGRQQRVCKKDVCVKWRSAESRVQWRQDNPDYDAGSKDRHRSGYWKAYRQAHAGQTERNRVQTRERMRRRRAMFATQDSIRKDPVGYLEGLRGRVLFATPDAIPRCIDGVITVLVTAGMFATQDSMDRPAGARQ